MSNASPRAGQLETAKKWVGVVVAVGSVLLGGSLGRAALSEANAAPLAAGAAAAAHTGSRAARL